MALRAGNNGDDSAEKHSMGTIWSRVPPTPRWSNTKLPRAGHLAQIQGAILGYYKGNLCVDMTNLSYLGPSPSTSKASPPSESQCTDSGPPRNGAWEQGPNVVIIADQSKLNDLFSKTLNLRGNN
ncbi:hypothetical protein V8E54_004436 [Elaphomyces granulatus]